MLICAAAPFSMGGDRPLVTEGVPCAPGEAGEFDLYVDSAESAGQLHHDATGSEPQPAEADAQECALLTDCAGLAPRGIALALPLAHLPVPGPCLATLERPPRQR